MVRWFATTWLPEIGDSITKIAVESTALQLSQEKIRFCAKLFSSFYKLRTISLNYTFSYFLRCPKQEYNNLGGTIFSKLFSGSVKSLSHIRLAELYTDEPDWLKQDYLKTIAKDIIRSNEMIILLSIKWVQK